MEVPGGQKTKVWVLISEMVGTALLAAAVNWGGTSYSTAQCAGLTVFIMALVFGPISGGHFNPAVTVAILIKHRHYQKCGPVLGYFVLIIIAQILGAMLGCAICLMGFPLGAQSGSKIPNYGHYLTQLCPVGGDCNDNGKLIGQVFLVEFMMTFLFVAFVIQIVKHNGAQDVPINAMCIGIGLYTSIQIASGISGGCINPAIGIVQPVFQRIMNGRIYPAAPKTSLVYQSAYAGATFLGGIAAGLFQRYVHEYMISKAEQERDKEIEMTAVN